MELIFYCRNIGRSVVFAAHMLLFLVPVHFLIRFVDDGVEVAEGGEAENVAEVLRKLSKKLKRRLQRALKSLLC